MNNFIKLLFVAFFLLSQQAVGQTQAEAQLFAKVNELHNAATLFQVWQYRTDHIHNTRKLFNQVYLRGISIAKEMAEMDQRSGLTSKKELIEKLVKIEKISKIKFYEIHSKSGKIIPNPKDIQLAALEFFQKYNPTVYQDLLKEASKKGIVPTSPPYRPTRRARLMNWTKVFLQQFIGFGSARLGLSSKDSLFLDNPMAFEQTLDSIQSPSEAASFALFVWGHQQTFHRINKSFPSFPKSLSNFIGMGVGMSLSSIMHELLIDKDVKACLFSNNDEACLVAGERWLSGDKYIGYMPEIVSLGIAAVGSHTVTSTSMRIMPLKATLAIRGAIQGASLFTPIGLAVTIGNFVIFLYLHEVTSPIVHKFWDPWNFKYLGWQLTEELKRDKPQFSEYIRSYKRNNKEMEWLKSHTGNLLQERDNYSTCISKALIDSHPPAHSQPLRS